MKILAGVTLVLLTTLAALWWLRLHDTRQDKREWQRLVDLQPSHPAPFDSAMLDRLPGPARRYFRFAIRPGTPLRTVAEIDMHGAFGLGNKTQPRYQRMQARQILAAPHGFVWAMRTESGLPISGSDSGLWTRFRILGLLPVARDGGNDDHRRSAFARYVAEAAFWTPAALLPGPGIHWEAVDKDTARVTVTHQSLRQTVDIHLKADGQPHKVTLQRWSNANPEGIHRLQSFGGYFSDFREVDGYRLPFHVEAGNMFEQDDYFPFFKADITDIRFPEASP
ncbi:MAG: hypothetical protein P1U64_01430 [Alcanivoracaceae bacterium]|nr:hypothetical protein [Alcanivoracaceae bacterium]